jgi:glycosyltransferase involved in cell wall biosynthesis
MLDGIKSFIRARMPTLVFWIGRLRRWLKTSHPVRVPEIDRQTYERQRLLIDVSHTSNADFLSGIQRVVFRLSRELLEQADQLAFEPVMVRLDSCHGTVRLVHAVFDDGHAGRDIIASRSAVTIRRNDIMLMLDSSWDEYSTFVKYIFPTIRSQNGKVVTCLYDLIPLTHPEYCDRALVFVFERWMPRMLDNSDAILCISRATQTSLENYLLDSNQTFEGGIGYFHLGADFQPLSPSVTVRKPDIATILMVGTLEPRKGIAVALAAFDILWKKGIQIRLRLIGRFGWSVHELVAEIKANPAFGTNLLVEMECSDLELRDAYDHADLVLSSSFVEGFGLPLVEAAALKKSLIVSDIPAYREVCGDDAIYFRAGDAADLADKLEQWIGDRTSPKSPKFISWSESARQAANRMQKLLN